MSVVNVETGELLDTINYAVHPAAELFPLLRGADFAALVADIREHGQMEPVVLDSEGQLIDGRNRARACQALGLDVKETRYAGDDVTQYVVSHNLHRRHLSDSQRAMIAARLAKLPHGTNRFSVETPDGDSRKTPTRSDVKTLLGVSEGSMHRAKVIERHGSPDLVALTSEGKVPLASAARVAEAEPDEQARFVSEVRAGVEPTKASKTIRPRPAPTPTDSSSAGVAARSPALRKQRADLIRELARQGYSSRQMPVKVGVAEGTVRQIAREHNIEIPADKTIGKARRIDSNRVVNETCSALAGLATGVDLIDYEALDTTLKADWADSLKESLSTLNALHRRINKEMKESTQ